MPVKIHNKEYTTVAERIAQFKTKYPLWSLESEIQTNADIIVIKAVIKDEDGRIIATGHAEEVRGSTSINKTSALENCETSAWGRALAACNFGGDQVASANEVGQAIVQQAVMEATDKLLKCNMAVQKHLESITTVKECLCDEDFDAAAEAFSEIPDDDRQALALASTKGGIWTLEETKKFADPRWSEARKRYLEDK